MTQTRSKEIFSPKIGLIKERGKDNPAAPVTVKPLPEKVEMLTIKECVKLVPGLSEYTVRKLVQQGKVKYIRAGEGKRGKILINKDSLMNYLSYLQK